MKSYTDLEQSKKLAEILPPESADMWYSYYGDSKYNPTIAYKGEQWFLCQFRNSSHSDIPCWSLAALISQILPDKVAVGNENYYLTFGKKAVEYRGPVSWDGQKSISSKADNLVDACYEMILKLNELKML